MSLNFFFISTFGDRSRLKRYKPLRHRVTCAISGEAFRPTHFFSSQRPAPFFFRFVRTFPYRAETASLLLFPTGIERFEAMIFSPRDSCGNCSMWVINVSERDFSNRTVVALLPARHIIDHRGAIPVRPLRIFIFYSTAPSLSDRSESLNHRNCIFGPRAKLYSIFNCSIVCLIKLRVNFHLCKREFLDTEIDSVLRCILFSVFYPPYFLYL